MRVVLIREISSQIVTACTDPSWKLCRQFCYAVVAVETKTPLCKASLRDCFATVLIAYLLDILELS